MSNFTIFRALLLLWNNSPVWFQRVLRALGLTRFVNYVWVPYRHLTIPPSEQPVRHLVRSIIQPGWLCADVGANFGMLTEVMAEKTGASGQVVAFEAHPLNAFILGRRMEVQGFASRVRIENKAVSDGTAKVLRLFSGRRRSPNEWNIVGHDVSGAITEAVMEIPSVCLDEYFGTQPIRFLKIDVEGAEIGVIAGMPRVLKEQRPICVVEFHNTEAWKSRQAFLDQGYTIHRLSDGADISKQAERDSHVLLCPPGVRPQPAWFSHA